jgi:diguanylate cyclase (GGDEF)-like protein/PAS domain S-box-containing protein
MSARFGSFSRRDDARRRQQRAVAGLRARVASLQARFDLVCQATADGLWHMEVPRDPAQLVDPATPCWYSPQFRRLLGYDEREAPNRLSTLYAYMHPDDIAPTSVAYRQHIEDRSGRTPYDVQFRLRHHDGGYRWFRARGQTERGTDGAALRIAGALSDITDRNAIISVKRNAETVIASLPAGLLILDQSLRVLDANRNVLQILGLHSADAIRGSNLEEVLRQEGLRAHARALLEEGKTCHGLEVTLDGKRVRLAASVITLDEGERRVLLAAEDVTPEHQLREQAREHAARHRDQAALLDMARDAIIVRGIDGSIQFWNKGAECMYGWSAQEVLGRDADAVLYPAPGESAAPAAAALERGEWSGELEQRRKDGSQIITESRWTLVRDDEQRPKSILVISTDITERKASDERIRTLALYDTLTGLPNRTLFADRLNQALAAAARTGGGLAVLFIDLNRFKEINDTQGHGMGDEVLVNVARRFSAALREHETLARLAGDEFVVIAQVPDREAASAIAARLEDALAAPVAARNHTFSVGLSVGISMYPRDGATIDDLLRCADIAMYRAKAAGGGHVFYQAQMSVGLAERMELAKDLQHALGAGKLQLYYQPQVCLETGALVGAEALLRWHDEQRGWVSPATFIPIAEARGMIVAIGGWVLREACRQLAAWRGDGLRFPGRMSVNLAAQQLDQAGIADSIQQIARSAGLKPDCLELELTESGVMDNIERATATMSTLKQAGFSIAIDDFGTGYSSLAYLKRLPADKLKIDSSFVREMLTDRHDYTIVNTIIGMARNLGLRVIAEGVEQSAQAQLLRALGCDEAQGYYYGRPVPADEFAQAWLEPLAVTV